MLKGMKQSNGQINPPEGILPTIVDLFSTDIPVWYEGNGSVSSVWLSICEEERNQTTSLLESVADLRNLQRAFKQVKANGGSSGVDKQSIQSFGVWFKTHYAELQSELLSETYRPNLVKGISIPKATGGTRELGIPTIKDRVVQQAVNQVLQPYYDPKFSAFSYGFRPHRDAHGALRQSCAYIKSGKTYIVDIDLAKFFDEVNHQRLLWLLGTRIGDQRLLRLIGKTLKTGILKDGFVSQRVKGTPQGSPLSPVLSNIVLDELDQELTRRGLSFVRYADDLQVFVSSCQSAERILPNLTLFIEGRMKLKVNASKSGIRRAHGATFLGYRLLNGGKLGLSAASESRLKSKLKELTRRNRGISFEVLLKEIQQTLQGWLNYFRLAQMKSKLASIEGWLRRRLRCFRLKQCKRVIGIVRFLRKLGVEKKLSWRTALSGKGWWCLSNSPGSAIGMDNNWFIKQGFYSLSANYQKLFRKPL
jgi:group II intron reverse transcriptase/maturase